MSETGPLHDAAIWQIRLIEDSATLSDPAFCAWLRLPVNADAFGRVSEAWALAGESLLQSRRTLDEAGRGVERAIPRFRSEEHTSELQSLMRISYDVLCLQRKHEE